MDSSLEENEWIGNSTLGGWPGAPSQPKGFPCWIEGLLASPPLPEPLPLPPPSGAHPTTHFLGSVKALGLAGVSSFFFQPAGKCLLRPLCLEKKDFGTEAESWKELD